MCIYYVYTVYTYMYKVIDGIESRPTLAPMIKCNDLPSFMINNVSLYDRFNVYSATRTLYIRMRMICQNMQKTSIICEAPIVNPIKESKPTATSCVL